MSRTWRRAAPANLIPFDMIAKAYLPRDTSRPLLTDEKRVRDGHAIRGCNADPCGWCSSNRVHNDTVRNISAEEQMGDTK